MDQRQNVINWTPTEMMEVPGKGTVALGACPLDLGDGAFIGRRVNIAGRVYEVGGAEWQGGQARGGDVALILRPCDEADFEDVTILRKDAPDVRFRGKLLVEVDSLAETRQDARKKDRWTKLELWELESGNWVAASIACSDKEGEVDFGDALVVPVEERTVIPRFPGDPEPISMHAEPQPLPEGERRRRVMAFFGWTWLAKALAREAGWDVTEELL